MTAYIIFTREKTRDPEAMKTYAKAARTTMAGHAATPLVAYGAFEVLEGAEIEGAVVLSFPTMAEAKAWYDSPAYTEARQHRFRGADYRAVIVEGL